MPCSTVEPGTVLYRVKREIDYQMKPTHDEHEPTRGFLKWLSIAALVVFSVASSGTRATLYDLANGSALYTIDPNTGAATFVVNVTGAHTSLAGLEFLGGVLYASDTFSPGNVFHFG